MFFALETFYKLNPVQFHIHLRDEKIIDFAQDRINETAGTVVRSFFSLVKDEFKTVKEDASRKTDLLI